MINDSLPSPDKTYLYNQWTVGFPGDDQALRLTGDVCVCCFSTGDFKGVHPSLPRLTRPMQIVVVVGFIVVTQCWEDWQMETDIQRNLSHKQWSLLPMIMDQLLQLRERKIRTNFWSIDIANAAHLIFQPCAGSQMACILRHPRTIATAPLAVLPVQVDSSPGSTGLMSVVQLTSLTHESVIRGSAFPDRDVQGATEDGEASGPQLELVKSYIATDGHKCAKF